MNISEVFIMFSQCHFTNLPYRGPSPELRCVYPAISFISGLMLLLVRQLHRPWSRVQVTGNPVCPGSTYFHVFIQYRPICIIHLRPRACEEEEHGSVCALSLVFGPVVVGSAVSKICRYGNDSSPSLWLSFYLFILWFSAISHFSFSGMEVIDLGCQVDYWV